MLAAALSYAAHGWAVLQINPSTKRPYTKADGVINSRGVNDATTDPVTIRQWWIDRPEAWVAVACRASGLLVLDVDVREGVGDGHATLADLEAKHGPLPRDIVQRSGGGGTHIIMADPAPGPDGWTRTQETGGCVNAKPGKLLDTKANGYILVEPSGRYRWESGAVVSDGGSVAVLADPPPVPESWIDVLRHPEAALLDGDAGDWTTSTEYWDERCAARLRGELRPLVRQRGQTDPTVLVVRKIFHDYGRSVDDGAAFFDEWNDGCGYPYDGHELRRQLDRCARHDFSDTERGWAAQPLLEPPPDDVIDAALAPEPVPECAAGGKNSYLHAPHSVQDPGLCTERDTDPYPDEGLLDEMVGASASAAAASADPYVAIDAQGFEVNEKGKRPPSDHNVERALELVETDLRFNEFARIAEVDGCRAQDHVIDRLRFKITKLFRLHAKPPKGDFYDHLLNVLARNNTYHPVRDYLAGVEPTWDGVPRLGSGYTPSWLTTYAGVADTPYARAIGRIVLVAAVKRVREPGVKFDEMLVLEGPTGWGKGRACKILAVNRDWYTDDLPIGEDSKVVIEQTRGKWIIEVPELVGMSKHDDRKLKSQLSRDRDVARAAYAREAEEHPRQSIMIATTNEYEYLNDRTGNRRWWPVRLGRPFDLAGLERDRDQLWAEAAAAETAGESIRLAEELWPAAAAEQERRRAVDPYEFKLAPLGDPRVQGLISVAEVWALAGVGEDPTPVQKQRISAAAQALGWERSRASGGRCYRRGTSERWWNAAEVRTAASGNTQPDLRVVS